MKVLITKIGQKIKDSIEKLKKGDVLNLEKLKDETDDYIKHFYSRLPKFANTQKMTPSEESSLALLSFTKI